MGTSLVVQWLKICLPMQGTQFQSPDWEVYTCCRATKPVCHTTEPMLLAHVLQQEKPPQREARAPHLERACMQQPRPGTVKNEQQNKYFF